MSAFKPLDPQTVRDALAREVTLAQPLPVVDTAAIESRATLRRIFELLGEEVPEATPVDEVPTKTVLISVSEVCDITGLTRGQVKYDMKRWQLPHAVRQNGRFGKEMIVDTQTLGTLLQLRCVRGGNTMRRIVNEYIA